LEAGLAGQRIEAVNRRAKYLLLSLSSGDTFAVQLITTGQLLLVAPEKPYRKTTRLVMDLDDGMQLRLADSSRLAKVYLLHPREVDERLPLNELGPEVIGDALTFDLFRRLVGTRKRQIKAVLLDQRVVSGLGNIYTDEVLFAARIHPLRLASSLSGDELRRLYAAIRRIVPEAIRLRGTTTRSYLDVLGRKGGYQERLQVVARAGKPCPGDCGGVVVREWMAGRDTYLCPSCQKLDAGARKAA
ncbi:MAG TPA: DNA-formamidopyrimidine glycosylase, partial [Chloroflexota bacterium]